MMLFEGFVLGSCDGVGLAVGRPFHVGSDDAVGDAEGASLGSDTRGSVMENAFSREIYTVAVSLRDSRTSPLTARSSVGWSKKRAGTVVVIMRRLRVLSLMLVSVFSARSPRIIRWSSIP
jgi:hypothetical protein